MRHPPALGPSALTRMAAQHIHRRKDPVLTQPIADPEARRRLPARPVMTRMPQELIREVQAVADADPEATVSSIVRQAVREFLARRDA